ncbi:FAD-dependent monooxygenase [Amycolatopsis vastitatis]|uniref:FAD-binding monooxygenase n=1 Tax=Amycolatopsis vastitatis TaxID=1905142 RepID=A0A229SNA3_9PSEU|nr:FAD-dependent monooxygenase [Amycolatopsis vastitatis]OXM60282.1 FAD-binding monooxygenase [Amycolatopsis vastitatis]
MTEVLIAGAGPTGLTLACDLARRGIAVRVVEKAARHATASRAKTIQPRTLEVADDLGVAERLLGLGAVHVPTRHYDRARVVSEAVEAAVGVDPAPGFPYPAPLWLAQPQFEAVLRDRLGELGGRVEPDREVLTVGQDADAVTVTVRTATGIEEIRARYVVGCDGGRSVVRREAGLELHGTRYGRHRWYLGDLRVDGLDRHCQHVWMSPEDGILSLFPLPGTDVFQFQASIPAGDENPAEPSPELYRRIFAERAGVPGVELHDAGWTSLYQINVCMVDRYRAGRVFLAGDAAHIHSPGGGQGMNTGVQDAYNLGWKLAAVLVGADPALLDSYEQERLPVARVVLDDSTARMHMVMRAAGDGDGSHAQRHLTDDFTTGLTIAYPESALSHRGSGPRRRVDAGDRAPDARYTDSAGRPARLFDLFRGPQWTLLAFGGTEVRPAGSLHVHAIDDEQVRRAYDVTDDELILVRPDGYLAGRGEAALDVWRRTQDVSAATHP